MTQDGVQVRACMACADSYGVSERLRGLGIEVKGMGRPLTDMLQQGWKVLTFPKMALITPATCSPKASEAGMAHAPRSSSPGQSPPGRKVIPLDRRAEGLKLFLRQVMHDRLVFAQEPLLVILSNEFRVVAAACPAGIHHPYREQTACRRG